jgi:tRNA(fMet)-specific endonuclease VapC
MQPAPVLLDTDTLSEISRGSASAVGNAKAYLALHGKLTISSITVFERLRGYHAAIRDGRPYHRQLQAFEALVANCLVLPFDSDAASVASSIWASSTRAQRQGLGDILIAAIAICRQLPLVTRNKKDFEGLSKAASLPLALLDWTTKARSR